MPAPEESTAPVDEQVAAVKPKRERWGVQDKVVDDAEEK